MRRSAKIWYLAALGFVYLLFVGVLFSLNPPGTTALVRGTAILGYLCVFTATVSSSFIRELVRLLGRKFVTIHHIVAYTGLLLITLHPLAVALSWSTTSVLVPKLDSVMYFLQWGGPPALYLLYVGSVVASFRSRIDVWRTVHWLNSLAFVLATFHAILLGTDTQFVVVKAIVALMGTVVVVLFVRKRRAARK